MSALLALSSTFFGAFFESSEPGLASLSVLVSLAGSFAASAAGVSDPASEVHWQDSRLDFRPVLLLQESELAQRVLLRRWWSSRVNGSYSRWCGTCNASRPCA